jgi:hypothetical protein
MNSAWAIWRLLRAAAAASRSPAAMSASAWRKPA